MNSLQKIRKTLLTAPEFEGRHPSQEHTGFFTPKRAKSVPNFALDLAGEDENGGVVPLPVIRDSDDDGGDRATCKCAKKLRSTFKRRLRIFNEVSATNLKIGTGAEAGLVGYPMYVFETIMGQYSARKPLMMLRFMLPALTGIGPALYLRTLVKAVNALGTFLYCAILAFSMFFCRSDNVLVYRFLDAEVRNKKFHLFFLNVSRAEGGTLEHDLYHWWYLIIFTVALLILVGQNLKLLGQVAMLVVRVLLLAMTGYLLVGLSRISEAKGNSVVYGPLLETLRPSWMKIFKGKAWMDAMIFVIQSLELGTLVQPYLASKNFFHYRCHRDGLYLILLAMAWNFASSIAALSWLGYVGVNKIQMKNANEHLFGHYGLTIVFMLKHLQAS
ncbi:Sodium- and chloride-dependent GABA transporter 2 [Folsomia candida]|uniref:Sodium-and chloride-dependent GABA transporter 2 n=1 Tax=Folsomia candida TaxID=158441 RepID=A0A226ER43_FOLCA|nr:Sodium- and chloride-dependent GABA transporter 2 [Folsomia candida]